MALNPKTPGVYIEEVSLFPPSIAPVATAIPAFIGYTETSVSDPVRISSMADYEATFGGPQPYFELDGDPATPPAVPANGTATHQFTLYYALQIYFANGGGPCYVASAGTYAATPAEADFGGTWNTGALGKISLEDEPTLIVIPDIGTIAEDNAYNVYKAALDQCARLQDRFVIIDVYGTVSDMRDKIGTQYLKYGAAYYPRLQTTLSYSDAAVEFNPNSGTNPTGTNNELAGKTLAEAVAAAETSSAVADQLITVERATRNFVEAQTITLYPGAAIAGVFAATDRNRGVWKAPANVSLTGVVKPAVTITHEDQEDLNIPNDGQGKSVNAIRSFTGKGILVWGARTLAGNDNEWRYVPVRRLFIFVEESIKKATEFVVFEPNDANTWLRVKTMIQNFLTNLWKDGALAGATPDDAFFVNVGLNETMTPQDILEGKLIIEIGMAAVRPAEFIILKFSHKLQES